MKLKNMLLWTVMQKRERELESEPLSIVGDDKKRFKGIIVYQSNVFSYKDLNYNSPNPPCHACCMC